MAKQATIRHSATGRRIQKQPTLDHLFASHRSAFDRLQIATKALVEIEERRFRGILVYTLMRVKPGARGAIPPVKKGEFRTFGTHAVARTHEDIDRLCNSYIRLARKEKKWGYSHESAPGRLDQHGIFCELNSPNCPPDGPVVRKGSGERSPFTKESLAAYRNRVRDLHKILDAQIEATAAANEASGWTAARDAHDAAQKREREIWHSITARAAIGTAGDIHVVCRYQRNLLEREFRRHQGERGTFSRESYDDLMASLAHYAQEIVGALARPRPRSAQERAAKVVPLMRKAA